MQNLKTWLPLISGLLGLILVGNGTFTVSDALKMDTSNIGVLAQGVISALAGLGFGAAGWYFKGGKIDSSTFDDDTQAVKHLATSCKGCKESEKALQVIHSQILQREFGPDDK